VEEIVAVLEGVIVQRTFHGRMDPASMIETHAAHIETVKATIPAGRLLIYRVQDGWEPLCRVLDVPVPDAPFPRSNSGSWPFVKRTLEKMLGRRWRHLSER